MRFPAKDFIKFGINDKKLLFSTYIHLANFRYPAVGQKPKGVMFLFHGFGSHSDRHVHVAKKFAEAGLDVVSFDYQGFGQSPGKRGYIHSQK